VLKKTGRRDIGEWGEIFAPLIFNKSYPETTPRERLFVHFHIHRYEEYRKKIAEYILKPGGPMAGRKLRGDQYECVFGWYRDRIPLYIVFKGIAECHEYARRAPILIKSPWYFDKAVRRHFEAWQISPNRVGRPSYSEGGKDRFYYQAYLDWERGMYGDYSFCGVIGPNNEGQGIKR